jgi:hypothetical protein
MEIGSVDMRLFKSQVEVRNVRLNNPPEFEEKLMAELPLLYVDYQLGSLLRREPHINDMTLDIKQIVIVKNKAGVSNVSKLRGVRGNGGDAGADASGKSATKYRLDTLRLKIGTVVVKDFSRGKPTERIIPLNIDTTYKNISDSTDVHRLVLLTVMSTVRLPDIGIKPEDLLKGLGGVTNLAGKLLEGTADVVTGTGKGVLDTILKVLPGEKKE